MFKVEKVQGQKEGHTILALILEDGHVSQRIQTVRCGGDQSFFPFKLTVRELKPYLSPLLLDYLICKWNGKSTQPDKNLSLVLMMTMLLLQSKTTSSPDIRTAAGRAAVCFLLHPLCSQQSLTIFCSCSFFSWRVVNYLGLLSLHSTHHTCLISYWWMRVCPSCPSSLPYSVSENVKSDGVSLPVCPEALHNQRVYDGLNYRR